MKSTNSINQDQVLILETESDYENSNQEDYYPHDAATFNLTRINSKVVIDKSNELDESNDVQELLKILQDPNAGKINKYAAAYELRRILDLSQQPHELLIPENLENLVNKLKENGFLPSSSDKSSDTNSPKTEGADKRGADKHDSDSSSRQGPSETSDSELSRFEKICAEIRKATDIIEGTIDEQTSARLHDKYKETLQEIYKHHSQFLQKTNTKIDSEYKLTQIGDNFLLNNEQITKEQALVVSCKRCEDCMNAFEEYKKSLKAHEANATDEKFTFKVKDRNISFDIKKNAVFKDIQIPSKVVQSMIVSLAPRDEKGNFMQKTDDVENFQVCYNAKGEVILLIPKSPLFNEQGQMYDEVNGKKYYFPVSQETFLRLKKALPELEQKQDIIYQDDAKIVEPPSNTPGKSKVIAKTVTRPSNTPKSKFIANQGQNFLKK